MSKADHRLVQVTHDLAGGWSGTCTCGRWGFAGAKSKGKLKDEHDEHARNPHGAPR